MTLDPQNPDTATYIVTDEAGAPISVVDMDQLQADAIAMAYDYAAASGDADRLDEISDRWLTLIGADGFGYVSARCARNLAESVIAPLLDVLDRLHGVGALNHDMRVGLAEARDYALATATTMRSR